MAWDSMVRKIDYKLTIGTTEYGKDKIIKMNLSEGFSGARTLGSVVSSQLNLELYLDNDDIKKGDKVILFVREGTEDMYMNTSDFTVNEIKRKGKTIALTCYDKLFFSDGQIGKIKSGGASGAFPSIVNGKKVEKGHLLSEYLSVISQKLYFNNRIGPRYPIMVRKSYPEQTSMRVILQDAAAIEMSSYMVDRKNNLVAIPIFRKYVGSADFTFNAGDYIECEVFEDSPKCNNVILNINNKDIEISSLERNPETAINYNLEYATQKIQLAMEFLLENTMTDRNFTMTCRGNFNYKIGDTIEVHRKDGGSFRSRIMHINTILSGGMTQIISCEKVQGVGELESQRDLAQSRFVFSEKTTSQMEDVNKVIDVSKNYTVIKHTTDPYYEYGKTSGKPISESLNFYEEGIIQSYVRTGGTLSSGGGVVSRSSTQDEEVNIKYEKAIGTELNKDGLFHLVDDVETGEVEKVRIPKTYVKDTEPDDEVGVVGDLWVLFASEPTEPTEPTEPEESPGGV